MPLWLTYQLQDFLLFSARTYHRLFERYHRDVWPLQVVTFLIGVLILFRVLRGRAMAIALASMWLWIAWVFHWQRLSTIQIAARWFAFAFVVEAVLIVLYGVIRDAFVTSSARGIQQRTGITLFAFALAAQPFIGLLAGRSWTSAEVFGITPDATAVATLGIALCAGDRPRKLLLIVPLLWCAVSGATLWTLHAGEALVLPGVAVIVVIVTLRALAIRRNGG